VTMGNKRRRAPRKTGGLLQFHQTKKARKPAPPKQEKRRSQAPASFLAFSLLVIVISCSAFVYHLHVRFEGVRLGYDTSQARAERARLLVERRELRLELASLKSPGEVETEAREKLGMDTPDHRRIIPIGKTRKPVLASGRAR
jgi:cell division protein FtsL